MNSPQSLSFTYFRLSPKIYSIDDAWFEGQSGKEDIVSHYDLNDISPKSVKELSYALDGIDKKPGDLNYLFHLSNICYKFNFALNLCNFEYLETNFNLINNRNNAILLDINYDDDPEKNPRGFGIRLLLKLLNGENPQAHTFFVTGYPEQVNEIIKDYKNSDYLFLLKHITKTRVRKGEKIGNDLNTFGRFFKTTFKTTRTEKEYAHNLFNVRKTGPHPQNVETFKEDTPNDLPFKNKFVELNEWSDSFPALYDISDSEPNWKPKKLISIDLLKLHLERARINLDTEIKGSIHLPVAPGMVFITNLIYFLKQSGISSITLSTDEPEESIVLELKPGENHKDFKKLKSDVQRRKPTGLSKYFINLIECNSKSVKDFAGTEYDPDWNQPTIDSMNKEELNGPLGVVKYDFTESERKIELRWYSEFEKV